MIRTVIAVGLLMLISLPAYGYFYGWNPNERPPIGLRQALRGAEALLGEEAEQWYCITVGLHGDEARNSKTCHRLFMYAAKDGSKKLVEIFEDGEGEVRLLNDQDFVEEYYGECRTGLEEIAIHLNAVLEANGYAERATVAGKQLVLRARTRTYQIHRKTELGEFSEELTEVIGPGSDGIIIEATEVSESAADTAANWLDYSSYYWRVQTKRFSLTEKGQYVKVEMQFGKDISRALLDISRALLEELYDAFGKTKPGLLRMVNLPPHGDSYTWNPKKRPPIALPQALQRAEALLGEDAKQWYCIEVRLYGNKTHDGKECSWNFTYATKDGSQKRVYIHEDGEGVVERLNGAIEWLKDEEGRRTGLEDIATRLNAVLAANGYAELATVTDNKLVLRLRPRTYRIHQKTESGDFGDELVEVIGPKSDGILIEASEIILFSSRMHERQTERCGYSYFGSFPAYFRLTRGNKPLKKITINYLFDGETIEERRFVYAEFCYGNKVSESLFLKLQRAFGESE